MKRPLISASSLDGICTVTVAGEFDIAAVPKFNVAIDTAMRTFPSKIAIDLSDVMFIDSSGVGALVSAKRRRDDVSVVLHRPSEQCRAVLEVIALDAEFEITP